MFLTLGHSLHEGRNVNSGDRHPRRENYDKNITGILEEGFGLLLERRKEGGGGNPQKEKQQTKDARSPRLCLLHVQTSILVCSFRRTQQFECFYESACLSAEELHQKNGYFEKTNVAVVTHKKQCAGRSSSPPQPLPS